MEVSGHLHAPAALPPEEVPPIPIGYEAGRAPESVQIETSYGTSLSTILS
jgi:hypothetical protein